MNFATHIWYPLYKQIVAQATTSSVVRISSDSQKSFATTSYSKLKEIVLSFTVTATVYFQMRTSNSSYTVWARIYKNDSPYGTERSTTSTSWVSFSEDLSWNANDRCQLFGRATDTSVPGYVQYFRIMCEPTAYTTPPLYGIVTIN